MIKAFVNFWGSIKGIEFGFPFSDSENVHFAIDQAIARNATSSPEFLFDAFFFPVVLISWTRPNDVP